MDDATRRKYRRGAGYVVVFAAAFLAWAYVVGPVVADVAGWSTASPPPDGPRERLLDTADTPYGYAKWVFVAGSLVAARAYDRRRESRRDDGN